MFVPGFSSIVAFPVSCLSTYGKVNVGVLLIYVCTRLSLFLGFQSVLSMYRNVKRRVVF